MEKTLDKLGDQRATVAENRMLSNLEAKTGMKKGSIVSRGPALEKFHEMVLGRSQGFLANRVDIRTDVLSATSMQSATRNGVAGTEVALALGAKTKIFIPTRDVDKLQESMPDLIKNAWASTMQLVRQAVDGAEQMATEASLKQLDKQLKDPKGLEVRGRSYESFDLGVLMQKVVNANECRLSN